MTRTQFLELQQSLDSDLPGFVARGDIMYLPPATSLLRGIHFDSSAFSKTAFYACTFFMPLCVPNKHLTLGHGSRLRIGGAHDNWNSDLPDLKTKLLDAMKTQALPHLTSTCDLTDFVKLTKPGADLPRPLEERGYVLTRLGRWDEAVSAFQALLATKREYQWQTDLAGEVSSFLVLLERDPVAAQKRTIEIENETRNNLKLPHPEGQP